MSHAAVRLPNDYLMMMMMFNLEGTSSRSTAYRKKRGLVYTADVYGKRSS